MNSNRLLPFALACANEHCPEKQGWIGYAGTHGPIFVHQLGLIKPRQT